ncbi:RNA polymerase sigma factor [Pedosphaera parvula]
MEIRFTGNRVFIRVPFSIHPEQNCDWQFVSSLRGIRKRSCSTHIFNLVSPLHLGHSFRNDRFPSVFVGTKPSSKTHTCDDSMSEVMDFESLVTLYYGSLYQFAFSLTRTEADACDLTQQTFYIWAKKGHQLRDASKVKTWLFTTLHREFLNMRRKVVRFPHYELGEMDHELPSISPAMVNAIDSARVVELLAQVAEPYHAPLSLFYMEDCSYKEIAEILDVPLGTVQSRISRGMNQLQQLISEVHASGKAAGKEAHGER